LNTKSGDENSYITNVNKTKEVIVNNYIPLSSAIFGINKINYSLCYVYIVNLTVYIKYLDANLNIVKTQNFNLNIKQKVSKIVPIYNKDSTNSLPNFIIITTNNEVYFVKSTSNDNNINFTFLTNPIYLTCASFAYAMQKNQELYLFSSTNNEVKKTVFLESEISVKRKSVLNVYNFNLGFITNELKPFYCNLNNFDYEIG
jgi:hypothetical protein